MISGEARRLERLVRDLLDLSRLDSREFSLSPRACDAAEVVRDAASAFAPQARELGLELRVVPCASVPAEVDPDRLGQIVANLVENALKYAATTVEVSAETRGPELAVIVTDDGPGIPVDDLTNVFTRLYTARGTTGREVGTGLGLAIVQELAAAMGGRATADAPATGGARIVVTLPAHARAPRRSDTSSIARFNPFFGLKRAVNEGQSADSAMAVGNAGSGTLLCSVKSSGKHLELAEEVPADVALEATLDLAGAFALFNAPLDVRLGFGILVHDGRALTAYRHLDGPSRMGIMCQVLRRCSGCA